MCYDQTSWIKKNIPITNFDIITGSNFIKYKNFTIVSHTEKKVYKIYNELKIYELSNFRFNLAYKTLKEKYIIPKIIKNKIINNVGLIELEYLEELENLNPLDRIFIFNEIIENIFNIDIKNKKLIHYELKNEYEKIFPLINPKLSHGDIHFKNVYNTTNGIAIIDWDNFSFQDEKLIKANASLLYLIEFLDNDELFDQAIKNILTIYSNSTLHDSFILVKHKLNISVHPGNLKLWHNIHDRLFKYII